MTAANGRLPPMNAPRIVFSSPERAAVAQIEKARQNLLAEIIASRGGDAETGYNFDVNDEGAIVGLIPVALPAPPADEPKEGAASDGLPADATEPAPAERAR